MSSRFESFGGGAAGATPWELRHGSGMRDMGRSRHENADAMALVLSNCRNRRRRRKPASVLRFGKAPSLRNSIACMRSTRMCWAGGAGRFDSWSGNYAGCAQSQPT